MPKIDRCNKVTYAINSTSICRKPRMKFKNGTIGCYQHNRKQFHRKPDDGDFFLFRKIWL